jgi:hypothetical protein
MGSCLWPYCGGNYCSRSIYASVELRADKNKDDGCADPSSFKNQSANAFALLLKLMYMIKQEYSLIETKHIKQMT